MSKELVLKKESSSEEIKCCFEKALELSQSDNEFSINLDTNYYYIDVWETT
ncbi:hypothetical protein FACS1894195_0160 [Bacteroidia bacterium]|nr:hypothetical protein FACS1894195_0160 [Bacteroidia bacterium]